MMNTPSLFNSPVRTALFGLVTLAILLTGVSLIASPARNKILEEVTVLYSDETPVLAIRLSYVFSYLGHFPLEEGKELRIRVRPVRVGPSDRKSVFLREGLRPLDGDEIDVDEVLYEGDTKEGPWLTIRFTRSVHYRVLPDADYRGIKIFIDPSD